MQLTRLLALLVCFASGASVPLITMAAEPNATTITADAFHTSSRSVMFDENLSAAELRALREELWALTSHRGTIHCTELGVDAPCADTISLDIAD